MAKPRYKLTAGGLQEITSPTAESSAPKLLAQAFVGASLSHPDLRRWTPLAGSADSDLLPDLGTLASRSRDLGRNHGVADGARQTLHDNIVGCGLRLSAKPNWKILGKNRDWAEEWGNNVEAWWQTWWGNPQIDAGESLNGDGLTSLMQNGAFMNGEGLALPLWRPERGYRFSTCLQIIEADRLSNPGFMPNSQTLRGGIEIDSYGKPLAYWIRKTHPGDMFLGMGLGVGMTAADWERIPATTGWGRRRVIHVHDKERAGQSHGKPALSSVMRQFKVLGDFTNAELKAAVVNAMVALVTESAIGQEGLIELLSDNPDALKAYQDSLAKRNTGSIDFNAGRIIPLQLGEKISSFTPGRPSHSFEAFVTTLFRHIAAGLHIPYELLMKDFSKTNYSSARAALLEAWRFFRGRRKWLSTYWLTPVYTLWLEEAINQGLVDAPDFYSNWEAYTRCFWIGDGRGWVDPLKEAQAAQLRMDISVSTLEAECAEQGLDWEEVLEQRARERKKMRDLGLPDPQPLVIGPPSHEIDAPGGQGGSPATADQGAAA